MSEVKTINRYLAAAVIVLSSVMLAQAKARKPEPVTIQASSNVSIKLPKEFAGYSAILILKDPQGKEAVNIYVTEDNVQYTVSGEEAVRIADQYLNK